MGRGVTLQMRGLQKKGEEALCWAYSSSSSHGWTDADMCRTHHIRPKGRSTACFLWVMFWLSCKVSGQGQWALGLSHTPKPWTMGVRPEETPKEKEVWKGTWTDLEMVILNEISRTNKDKYMISLICGILKNDTNGLIFKTEKIESQM